MGQVAIHNCSDSGGGGGVYMWNHRVIGRRSGFSDGILNHCVIG